MAHTIPNRCINCGDCAPQCPTGAVKLENGEFWIDPTLCNDCEGDAPKPECVIACPINLSPMPLKAKKGRCKTTQSPMPSPSLFSNGKTAPFASAIAIWEACNVLSQGKSLPWKTDHEGKLYYKRQVNGGRASISFRLTKSLDFASPALPKPTETPQTGGAGGAGGAEAVRASSLAEYHPKPKTHYPKP
ncbi:MAG TPA: hypothetical protein DCQ63_08500, partial [Planktothrix sp. UBA8402]|nr:hypothetical protein [Planktothrix sp. UBA8402]